MVVSVGRPFTQCQWRAYQEHFWRLREPPERKSNFSQVCAMWARVSVISDNG